MLKLRVCALLMMLLLPGCDGGQEDAHSPQFDTQIEYEGGLVKLPVSVNGAPPQSFILDTGLNSMILSQAVAQDVGALPSGKTIGLQGVSGVVTPVEVVRNLLVEVGGLQWALAGAMVAPVKLSQPIEEITGEAFHGMLGAPLFEQYAVTLDFQTQQIQLSPSQSFHYRGTGEILKLSFKGRKPHIKATVQTTSTSKPIEGEFLIDLGSTESLDLRGPVQPSMTRNLPQRITAGLGGERQYPMGRIHLLMLGRYQLNNPITSFETSNQPSNQFSKTQFAGRIGTQILSQFKVIFNYAKKQVILESTGSASAQMNADMSGLRLILARDNVEPVVTVNHVYPGTPAQDAGIKPGDRLLAIDDLSVNTLKLHEIRNQFVGVPPATRKVTLQRNNTILTVEIHLRRLI